LELKSKKLMITILAISNGHYLDMPPFLTGH